mgnify:CR=1 FL=1
MSDSEKIRALRETELEALLKREHVRASFLLELSSVNLARCADRIKECMNEFREDSTNGGKSLQVYVAVNTLESTSSALLYQLRRCRDKMDALMELKNESVEDD